MVRQIKDSRKNNQKNQGAFDREKGWNDRFIYNKLEDNYQNNNPINKPFTSKKTKNNYENNINYLRNQFSTVNQKSTKKNRGKSSYKPYHNNNNNNCYTGYKIPTNTKKQKIKNNNDIQYPYDNINFFENNFKNNYNYNMDINNNNLKFNNNSRLDSNNKSDINPEYNNNIKMNDMFNNNYNYNVCQTNNSNNSYNNMNINQLEIILGAVWNKLGVKETFIKIFNNNKENLENDDAKKQYLIMEIENLEKIEKILEKLKKDIENREKTILLLQKLIEVMERQFIELDLDIRENILSDFYQAILGYRIISINVVENYNLFKQFFTYPIMKGKFDEEFILRKYHINENNENYLLKMKNDLSFLGKSKINGYKQLNIFFNVEEDPFLLSVVDEIPLNPEYYNRVQQCQYIIMQEIIFDKMNNKNNLLNITDINENEISKNKKKKLEPIPGNSIKIRNKNNNKENISCIDKKTEVDENNDTNLIGKESQKNISNIIQKENEKYFYNDTYGDSKIIDDQSEDQVINEINKNIDNIKKFSKKCENKKNDIKIVAIDKTQNNSPIENNIIKDDELVNIDENININNEMDKKIKVLSISKNNDKIEDNNDIEENILENSLLLSKKLKTSQQKSRSVTPETKHNLNNKKSINEENINNKDNNLINSIDIGMINNNFQGNYIAYYCGTLSNFITLYKKYYQTIPETQKIILDLKEDPIMHLQNNYYPKIIICSDKKSRIIKGLCIFSYIFSNEVKYDNSLVIEHISTYNENEMQTIFENLFKFIKENAYNNYNNFYNKKSEKNEKEIYIDLYYKYENDKFEIDKNIRDFFKDNLKFKWVKLENKSRMVRYQKMRHVFIIDDKGNPEKDLLINEYDDNNILNESRLNLKKINDKDSDSDSDSENSNSSNSESINHNKKTNNNLINFYIKNKTILKFSSNKENKDNNQEEIVINTDNNIKNDIRNVNLFNIIYLSKKIKEKTKFYDKINFNIDKYFNTNDTNFINETINNWSSIKLDVLLPKNSFYTSNIKDLIKFFSGNANEDYFKIYSNINILPTFDNCISLKCNNFYYNRIQNNSTKLLIEKETKQLFYFITPKDNKEDSNMLLISTNINSEFKNKFLNNTENNINIDFINIYNNLIPYEEENDKKIILYLPSFKIKCKICNENKHGNEKYSLQLYKETFDIECLNEDLLARKCNKKCKKENVNSMNFDYDLKDNDECDRDKFMINNDFLFVIINSNLSDNNSSLPMMTLYVSKNDFIKNEE